MKFFRLLILILVSFFSFNSKAQQSDTLFYEGFDTSPANWQMTRSNIPISITQLFQLDTIVTINQSYGAATASVGNRTESYLTTPIIDIRGFLNISMSFEQICYIEQFDAATLQISIDSGASWNRLPPQTYFGSHFYDWGQGDFKFTKFSSSLWPNGDTSYLFTANTNLWAGEEFKLDTIINFQSVESIMLRLALIDGPASQAGSTGTHRWIVDDFIVFGDRIVGLEENQFIFDKSISLYPNPAKEWVNIENNNKEQIEIILRDIKGTQVMPPLLTNQKNQKVNISNLSSGIYFVEVKSNQGRKLIKLIK